MFSSERHIKKSNLNVNNAVEHIKNPDAKIQDIGLTYLLKYISVSEKMDRTIHIDHPLDFVITLFEHLVENNIAKDDTSAAGPAYSFQSGEQSSASEAAPTLKADENSTKRKTAELLCNIAKHLAPRLNLKKPDLTYSDEVQFANRVNKFFKLAAYCLKSLDTQVKSSVAHFLTHFKKPADQINPRYIPIDFLQEIISSLTKKDESFKHLIEFLNHLSKYDLINPEFLTEHFYPQIFGNNSKSFDIKSFLPIFANLAVYNRVDPRFEKEILGVIHRLLQSQCLADKRNCLILARKYLKHNKLKDNKISNEFFNQLLKNIQEDEQIQLKLDLLLVISSLVKKDQLNHHLDINKLYPVLLSHFIFPDSDISSLAFNIFCTLAAKNYPIPQDILTSTLYFHMTLHHIREGQQMTIKALLNLIEKKQFPRKIFSKTSEFYDAMLKLLLKENNHENSSEKEDLIVFINKLIKNGYITSKLPINLFFAIIRYIGLNTAQACSPSSSIIDLLKSMKEIEIYPSGFDIIFPHENDAAVICLDENIKVDFSRQSLLSSCKDQCSKENQAKSNTQDNMKSTLLRLLEDMTCDNPKLRKEASSLVNRFTSAFTFSAHQDFVAPITKCLSSEDEEAINISICFLSNLDFSKYQGDIPGELSVLAMVTMDRQNEDIKLQILKLISKLAHSNNLDMKAVSHTFFNKILSQINSYPEIISSILSDLADHNELCPLLDREPKVWEHIFYLASYCIESVRLHSLNALHHLIRHDQIPKDPRLSTLINSCIISLAKSKHEKAIWLLLHLAVKKMYDDSTDRANSTNRLVLCSRKSHNLIDAKHFNQSFFEKIFSIFSHVEDEDYLEDTTTLLVNLIINWSLQYSTPLQPKYFKGSNAIMARIQKTQQISDQEAQLFILLGHYKILPDNISMVTVEENSVYYFNVVYDKPDRLTHIITPVPFDEDLIKALERKKENEKDPTIPSRKESWNCDKEDDVVSNDDSRFKWSPS